MNSRAAISPAPNTIRRMPRSARAVVAGRRCHPINRGNARARVFASTAEYEAFVDLIREARQRIELDLFGVCLMPNYLQLHASPRHDADLGIWMHRVLSTHVRRLHWTHGTSGRVWQGRFKAFPVQHDARYLGVLRYIERNALRAGLVSRAEDWPWGSLGWRDVESPPVRLSPFRLIPPLTWGRRHDRRDRSPRAAGLLRLGEVLGRRGG